MGCSSVYSLDHYASLDINSIYECRERFHVKLFVVLQKRAKLDGESVKRRIQNSGITE